MGNQITSNVRCQEHSIELEKTWNEIDADIPLENHEERFDKRVMYLMNQLGIVAGMATFRIVDCEIYYYSQLHQDPYCHKNDEQLNSGTWFYNYAGGLDITFGDRQNKIYASILIRAIRNLETNKTSEGITKVVREIFKQMGSTFTLANELRFCKLNTAFITQESFFRTTRVNLTEQKDDTKRFFDKAYRYIIDSHLSPALKDKDRIVTQLVHDGKISKDQAYDILGYHKKDL